MWRPERIHCALVSVVLLGCGRLGFGDEPRSDGTSTTDGIDDTGSGDNGMVVVAAGPFMMGCNEAIDTLCAAGELPYHQVTLSAYEIDRTEVTQAAYAACVTAGACTMPVSDYDPVGTPTLPVRSVDWFQASAYCAYAGKRLPTEAEWEKAARGTDGRTFPWGEDAPSCTLVAMTGCPGGPTPVGSHPLGASPYGALDMSGNVWEWVADWWSGTYYSASPAIDPTGPSSAAGRGMRGGFYSNGAINLRCAIRADEVPTVTQVYLGFRCARSL